MHQAFGSDCWEYSAKYFSQGKVCEERSAEVCDNKFMHNIPMTKGCAGSPIFDATTHQVVGMHLSGVIGEKRFAIKSDFLSK